MLQRSLPATPASVRLGRMTARVACRAWRVPALEESAALVVSELLTTVLAYSDGNRITLRVRMTPRRLRIELHDPRSSLPADLAASERDAPAVAVVEASSIRWGLDHVAGGCEVWAELAL